MVKNSGTGENSRSTTETMTTTRNDMTTSLPSRIISFLFIIFILVMAQFGFACYAILVKAFATASVSPILFSLLRDMICVPFLGTLALVLEGPMVPALRDWPIFILLGFTGIFGNQIGFILGVFNVGASISSIYQPSIPVWALLFGLLSGLEPIRWKTLWVKVIGVVAVCGGAVLMLLMSIIDNSNGSSEAHSNFLWGNIFLIGNCIAMALYILIQKKFFFTPQQNSSASHQKQSDTTDSAQNHEEEQSLQESELNPLNGALQKKSHSFHPLFPCIWWWNKLKERRRNLKQKYPPLIVTFYSYLCGIIFMFLATSISFGFFDHKMFQGISVEILIPLLYSAIVQSCICYGLISYANSKVSSTVVTAVWPAQVPITIILSAIFFQERLLWNHYLGAVLICGGLLLVCGIKYLEEEWWDQAEKDPLQLDAEDWEEASVIEDSSIL